MLTEQELKVLKEEYAATLLDEQEIAEELSMAVTANRQAQSLASTAHEMELRSERKVNRLQTQAENVRARLQSIAATIQRATGTVGEKAALT